jgi:3-oxoacyl-[acyl-carrier-protein] synthase-3
MNLVVDGVCIEGISAAVPSNRVDNLLTGRELFGESLGNAVKATGVRYRHVCAKPGTTALDLSIRAAEALLNATSTDPEHIGSVVFVTFTPDHPMPFNAALCQARLGLSTQIAAFDVNLACSGYPYGLYIAGLLAKSTGKKVLLLDGDKQSHLVSSQDRATSLLFSDAGTATIVAPSADALPWFFGFHTDGRGAVSLCVPSGGARQPATAESLSMQPLSDGGARRLLDIHMNGLEVFKFVVNTMPGVIQKLVDSARIDLNDIDFAVFHQANRYMILQAAKALKIDAAKVPLSIDKYGNVSSASIPLTIASELGRELQNHRRLILAGFGAGLSIGGAIVHLGPCVIPDVIFVDE